MSEEIKHSRQQFGRNADSGVAYTNDGRVVLDFACQGNSASSRVYLAALLSKFVNTCVSRALSPIQSDRVPRQTQLQFVTKLVDHRSSRLDGLCNH